MATEQTELKESGRELNHTPFLDKVKYFGIGFSSGVILSKIYAFLSSEYGREAFNHFIAQSQKTLNQAQQKQRNITGKFNDTRQGLSRSLQENNPISIFSKTKKGGTSDE